MNLDYIQKEKSSSAFYYHDHVLLQYFKTVQTIEFLTKLYSMWQHPSVSIIFKPKLCDRFPVSEAKTTCIERFSAGSKILTVECNSGASVTKWAWELKFFKLPLLSLNYFCTYNEAITPPPPPMCFLQIIIKQTANQLKSLFSLLCSLLPNTFLKASS